MFDSAHQSGKISNFTEIYTLNEIIIYENLEKQAGPP